ncbi:MAG: hypothetical protein JSS30_04155 [Verrucomicrobia bacterium]|nr:hypothetical protein [Verrucomicrobiota bacterium]
MNKLFSLSKIKELLAIIVASDQLHAKWLNTLSYLENCGARKIASCEHPTLVREEMLKHAAEEFRHAHYLKKQIQRISSPIETYALESLLGGVASLQYLNRLDLQTCRYLKFYGLERHAYLLVTYAIELRAEMLYPLYHEVLRSAKSPITVKSILLEEEEHLKEMREGLKAIPLGMVHAEHICARENRLFETWISALLLLK